jgi:hypothetical protein
MSASTSQRRTIGEKLRGFLPTSPRSHPKAPSEPGSPNQVSPSPTGSRALSFAPPVEPANLPAVTSPKASATTSSAASPTWPITTPIESPMHRVDTPSNALTAFRTLLTVAEKALDGLPVWGLNSITGIASEVLKIVQVRHCS